MSTAGAGDHFYGDLATGHVPYGVAEQAMLACGEQRAPHAELPPEHRLMIALVVDAIRCIHKYRDAHDSCGQRRFAAEAGWILSDDTKRLYSFVRICETLSLDPAAVRRSLGLSSESARAAARTAQRLAPRRPCERRHFGGVRRRAGGASATAPSPAPAPAASAAQPHLLHVS